MHNSFVNVSKKKFCCQKNGTLDLYKNGTYVLKRRDLGAKLYGFNLFVLSV